MDFSQFKSILTAFADTPADLDIARGTAIVQVRDDLIEISTHTRNGSLYVDEQGTTMLAETWIITRLARLPLLADRILGLIPAEPFFVFPKASLLDELEHAPTDEERPVDNAIQCALEVLGRRPGGVSSVLYLTSDAGEGKTTLISQLARLQAQHYKDKKTDWLILPVSLGGRTFMRFDDVVIGALVNRLRFPLLYYDAFIELVRLGVVVPALDGFEEMFVEGASGDAISALGNLMQTLRSSGSVLVAARKAYFEYKSLHTQSRLFDSLKGTSVSFSRLALQRWDRAKFIEYSTKRSILNGADIFEEVSGHLGAEHPLLTRAVLVRQLLDIASRLDDRRDLLVRIQSDPDDYFNQFVGSIITREAKEKWIDKVGEPAQPLISDGEHYELLAAVAHEMWINNTESIRADVLGFVAEIFAESKHKSKDIARQIVERIKQHALIVQADSNAHLFSFDHQEFYHFFLGEALGRILIMGNKADLRQMLAERIVPSLAMDTAAHFVLRQAGAAGGVIETISSICASEARTSFVKDNFGGIVIRLLSSLKDEQVSISHSTFPPGALSSRRLANVLFEKCHFQATSLDHSYLRKCTFLECDFERLEVGDEVNIEEVRLCDCTCAALMPKDAPLGLYASKEVMIALGDVGFTVLVSKEAEETEAISPDPEVQLVERFCRAFLRATEVNENTVKQRMGTAAAGFLNDVLPQLEQRNIVVEVAFRGKAKQRRFKLNVPLERINESIEVCGGRFATFLDHAMESATV